MADASDNDLLARVQVLEDIEEIRKLKAAYCAACDDDHNGDRVADLFIEEGGVWGSGGSLCNGLDEIRAFMFGIRSAGFMARSAHQVFNPVIEVDGDSATADWRFLMMYTVAGRDDAFVRIIGRYEDEYVRTADGWRFKTLIPIVEERGEYQASTKFER